MTDVASMDERRERTLYLVVWGWLVFLLLAWLAIFALPLPPSTGVVLILGIAAVKAGLILRNYMNLKYQHPLIYVMAIVPVLFFIGFILSIIPDIVYRYRLGY